MSHWRRLVIDSRYRTKDSENNANFKVALKYPVQLPAGSKMYVDGVNFAHSWSVVETDRNDRLYVLEHIVATGADNARTIQLPMGDYNVQTLRTQLQTSLNAGRTTPGAYSVTLANGRYVISNASPVADAHARIYTEEEQGALKLGFAPYVGHHANELIGHRQQPTNPLIYQGNSLYLAYVDIGQYKQMLLHAPGLGESSMQDLRGNTDIVRRVLLQGSTTGDVVTSELSTGLAPITFSSDCVLSVLAFQVKDQSGYLYPLHFHEISFELVIVRPGDE
jgi:hypothetical protein